MTKICILFRKTDPGFHSIERIFKLLAPEFSKDHLVETKSLPTSAILPFSLIKNYFFLRKIKASIYHVTGSVHYVVLWLPSKKTILTIHDCGFLKKSKGLKRWIMKVLFLKMPVKRCAAITTISEFSKRDIIAWTGCPEEKITVIPNPVDSLIYYKEKKMDPNLPVILFIGSTPNKNLDRVIEAVQGISCHLEIVGHVTNKSVSRLIKLNIRHTISYDLTDQELAAKYAEADIVLFPSTFEGFGLPIIEANKAGRPIITSNLSPMQDVANGAAWLVDPHSVDSIREGLIRVINDTPLRWELVKKGFENVKKYEHNSIAGEYLSLYSKVSGKRPAVANMAKSLT